MQIPATPANVTSEPKPADVINKASPVVTFNGTIGLSLYLLLLFVQMSNLLQ